MRSYPDVLYHYTSFNGLVDIVRSGTLWASSPQYLNDARELTFGVMEVNDWLKQHAAKVRAAAVTYGDNEAVRANQEDRATIIDELCRTSGHGTSTDEVFITSFCADHDLLSQWRSYGSGGCAIGFRREALECMLRPKKPQGGLQQDDPLAAWTSELVQMQYGKGKVDLFEQALIAGLPTESEVGGSRKYIFERPNAVITKTLASIKDPAFEEEKEWRLLVSCDMVPAERSEYSSTEPTCVRANSGRLIPYIAVPYSNDAIYEVVIGPSRFQELNVKAALTLMNRINRGISVRSSDAPYVG